METGRTDEGNSSAQITKFMNERNGSLAEASLLTGDNAQFVETLYQHYLHDPASVSEEWREYFTRLSAGAVSPFAAKQNGAQVSFATVELEKQARVLQLINAYRVRGHFDADLDPLGIAPKPSHPELDPAYYGFTDEDLDQEFPLARLFGMPALTLRGILSTLRATYCGTMGIEFRHIQDTVQRRWILERVEDKRHRKELSSDTKRMILSKLLRTRS